MADNLNDLFQNFQDKSLEELGSSLLNRQAEINRKQAKEDRKSEKIGALLATIGVGQKIFKNAYDKRAKEIDDMKIFELSNNEEQQKRISGMANIIGAGFNEEDLKNLAGPNQEWATMSLDEKTDAYMNSPYRDILEQKLKMPLDVILEQGNIFDNLETFKNDKKLYNGAKEVAMKGIVKKYLENNNYQKFNNSIKNLVRTPSGEFLSEAETLERAMNLRPHELTRYEQALFDREKRTYRDIGVFEGIKHAFRKVGRRQEEEGGINMFKEIKHEDLYGNLDSVIAELDISANMTLSVQEYMKEMKGSERDVIGQANEDERGLESMGIFINSFSANQNTRSVYKSTSNPELAELLQMAGKKGRFEDFWEDVSVNPIEGPAFIRDTLALEKLIDIKPKLAESIYESKFEMLYGNKPTESDMQKFKNLITDDVYKKNFVIMVMGTEGFKIEKAWYERGKERYDGLGIVGDIGKAYSYDRFSGLIPSIFHDGINTPSESKSGSFEIDENWEKLDRKNKLFVFDTHYENIDNSKLSTTQKEVLIENLFASVPHPDNLTVEDYKAMKGMTSFEKFKTGLAAATMTLRNPMTAPVTGTVIKELITSPTVNRTETNIKTKIGNLKEENAPEETIEKEKEKLFKYQINNSDNAIVQLLLSDEGYRTNVYEDSEGFLTAGIGHKLTEQEKEIYQKGDYVPTDIIREWTNNDVNKFINITNKVMEDKGLLDSKLYKENEDMFVSFFYQLGEQGGLAFNDMWDAIGRGDAQAAHNEALNSLWAKQTPKRAKRFAKMLLENVGK